MKATDCPLCEAPGGVLVFQAEKFRVIHADEANFPAFYRLVWTEHVAEFSDLSDVDQGVCMGAVAVVERVLREVLQPTKINLAALGNVVPHLHWHIVARFDWDSHYPAPLWAAPCREAPPERLRELRQASARLHQRLSERLQEWLDARPVS